MNDQKIIENKKEDSSAFGKFIIILLIAFVVGGVLGFAAGYMEDHSTNLGEVVLSVMGIITPFAMLILTTFLIIIDLVLERQCRRAYSQWDGEDDEVMNWIDLKMNYILIMTSVTMILSYFCLGAGFYCIDGEDPYRIFTQVRVASILIGLIYSTVASTLIQKRVINFEKELNPEKKGSIYDPKFHKKWVESCDEAEKMQIYKASYKAYQTSQMTCIVLWVVSIMGMFAFDFGIAPMTFIIIIWLVMTMSYSMECLKYCKHPSEIMK